MTFSLIGLCRRTGQLGLAVTTSSMAVGARVPYARAGVGAVLTQSRTDPRLGPRGIELLASGCTAQATVAALVASTTDIAWRQLAVMDATGCTAAYNGSLVREHLGQIHAPNCVVIGNIVANDRVVPAAANAFTESAEEDLVERLLLSLEAGNCAGGEPKPLRSAALLIVDQTSFPFVDLRVDGAPEPLAALRALWIEYRPLSAEFVLRALKPDHVDPPA